MAFVVMMVAELHNGRRACFLAIGGGCDERMTASHLVLTCVRQHTRAETTP
jgi:hypothetical protein